MGKINVIINLKDNSIALLRNLWIFSKNFPLKNKSQIYLGGGISEKIKPEFQEGGYIQEDDSIWKKRKKIIQHR